MKTAGYWWDGRAGVWYLARCAVYDGNKIIPHPFEAAVRVGLTVAAGNEAEILGAYGRQMDNAGVRGMELANGIA
jgi:hypothetical protein